MSWLDTLFAQNSGSLIASKPQPSGIDPARFGALPEVDPARFEPNAPSRLETILSPEQPLDLVAQPKAGSAKPGGAKPKGRKAANEICDVCCEDGWLVVIVDRKTKWISDTDLARPGVGYKGKGDWYVTTGTMRVEKWSDEKGSSKTVLWQTGSVERGGPSTTESGKSKMVPAGTYTIAPMHGKLHSTNQYKNVPMTRQYPAVNVRGNGVGADRGIDIHSGGSWVYTVGCILPVPEAYLQPPSEPIRIAAKGARLPPVWTKNAKDSHDLAIKLINEIKAFKKVTGDLGPLGVSLKCVKMIINETGLSEAKIRMELPPAKPKTVAKK